MHSLKRILTTTHARGFKCISLSHIALPSTKQFLHQQIPVSNSVRVFSKANLATLSESKDVISVKVDKETFKFPSIWLRDNCQCPSCFHSESQSRTIDWQKFDFGAKPLSVKFEGSELKIEWSDNHRSTFAVQWLRERLFTQEKRELFRNELYRFQRITWGAELYEQYLKKFDYKAVLSENSALLEWLESLTKYGVAILTDVPADNNSNKILTQRVAFVRKTHYGEEFVVETKKDATNVAYLSATLPLHTDLPYYHYSPGVNLLHCSVQAEGQGGDSWLVDAFHVANYMKLNHPDAHKVLTKTLVDWNDVGHENGDHFHSLYQAPVLCEDEFGDLVRVNFSQPQRDSHFNSPLEQIIPWYQAAGLFTKLLHSPENLVTFKLAEGEILTFDNLRLVHGRSTYSDKAGRERRLIGCYLDWDEIYSRIRVLRKELKKELRKN